MSACRSLSLLNLWSTEQTFSQPRLTEITLCINSKSLPFTFIVLSPLLLQSPPTNTVHTADSISFGTKHKFQHIENVKNEVAVAFETLTKKFPEHHDR
jgi:hypothetical protein